jgi:hypothetical protein
MRTALLAGAAAGLASALALLATAGARAETIYVTDPDAVVAPGYVVTSEPSYVVRDRSYIVAEPPAVVVPRRERVVVVPRREVVIEPTYAAPTYAAPRDSFAYRGTVRNGNGYVTTAYSSGSSCMIDINGFERCY